MKLLVKKFVLGPLSTNTYLVHDENGNCIIFDPSSGCEAVLKEIDNSKLVPEAIVLTHAHFDHIIGIDEIKQKHAQIPVYIHPDEKIMLENPQFNGSFMIGLSYTYTGPTKDLVEGKMRIGSFDVDIMLVPGHSPGGCAIKIDKYLFCGDILFAGSIGRSDLLGGDGQKLINGIKEKIIVLPDETVVCSGHGGRTTIGREKKTNPYLTDDNNTSY
ncbi:MAG TPA: MBL fold metallo-hydrolase [Chitinispirillaceae bacterium]|nr:MBL fold metallo-hydrolase [Chitinispirillaceae bacterium]